MSLYVAGLFAGIGGLELGFERAGYRSVLLNDLDPAAETVLRKQFPNVEYKNDAASVDMLPDEVSVVCAGFPCQDLSMAGGKAGFDGAKSGVVKLLFELLQRRPVQWVVIENVYFMLHLAKGAGMRYVIEELERLGYRWAYRVVDSRAFGLAQRRRRLFIVAAQDDDPRDVLLADDVPGIEWPPVDLEKPIGFFWTEGHSGHGLTADAIPPLKVGSGWGIPSPPAVLLPNGRTVMPSISSAERLQGFPAGWTDVLEAEGSGRARWRLLGNAVSVPVAEWIARKMLDVQRAGYVDAGDPLIDRDAPWPKAAYNVTGERRRARVSEHPVLMEPGRLSDMDTDAWPDLSSRALRGFVARARRSRLRYPAGFLEKLEECLVDRGTEKHVVSRV